MQYPWQLGVPVLDNVCVGVCVFEREKKTKRNAPKPLPKAKQKTLWIDNSSSSSLPPFVFIVPYLKCFGRWAFERMITIQDNTSQHVQIMMYRKCEIRNETTNHGIGNRCSSATISCLDKGSNETTLNTKQVRGSSKDTNCFDSSCSTLTSPLHVSRNPLLWDDCPNYRVVREVYLPTNVRSSSHDDLQISEQWSNYPHDESHVWSYLCMDECTLNTPEHEHVLASKSATPSDEQTLHSLSLLLTT